MTPYDYKANKHKLVDSTKRRLSTGMFTNFNDVSGVFQLEDWHDMYVAISDPTEYKTAMILLGDWDHWKYLRANPVLDEIFNEWLKEVEAKVKSEAIEEMKALSKTDKGAAAARWLAEAGFRTKVPTKAAPKSKLAPVPSRVAGDAARLGLVTPIKEKTA